jgi:hypothetical protein
MKSLLKLPHSVPKGKGKNRLDQFKLSGGTGWSEKIKYCIAYGHLQYIFFFFRSERVRKRALINFLPPVNQKKSIPW